MPRRIADLWWLFTRQTVMVTETQSVLAAASLMMKRNFRHLPVVTETGKIVGIISAQDVIDSLNLVLSNGRMYTKEILSALSIPVEGIMTYHCICVEQGDGLVEIAKKMTYNNLGALPVIDEQGKVQGIVTLRDLVGLIGTSSEPLGVPVSEIMNTHVITIDQDSHLPTAVRLMSENRVRRLPILKRGAKPGMLTNRDVLRRLGRISSETRVGLEPKEEFDAPVSDFMTREAIIISQEDDVRVAASTMTIFGIGGLVIGDPPDGRMSLVTERDLIRTFASKRGIDALVNAMQFEREVDSVTI